MRTTLCSLCIHLRTGSGNTREADCQKNTHPDKTGEYFKRHIFHPCLDTFISGPIDRFNKNKSTLEDFDFLIVKQRKKKEKKASPLKIKLLQKRNIMTFRLYNI